MLPGEVKGPPEESFVLRRTHPFQKNHKKEKKRDTALPSTPTLQPLSFPPSPPAPFTGAWLPSAPVAAADLCGFARLAADGFQRGRLAEPASSLPSSARAARRGAGVVDRSAAGRVAMEKGAERVPLSEVVADCVRRWFQDTLKEARAGDVAMQVLVGQMYCSGYGVARNEQKGKAWIIKASQSRSSALRVGDKRPGYNASDSDSDDLKDDTK